ncbi:MAG: methyltransferase domain-containing protein [Pseudomonadota bacterium]
MSSHGLEMALAEELYAAPLPAADPASCTFYHTMDLPGVGLVRGQWDLRGDFAPYTDHYDFTGKRVLDIGAGGGFLSFSAEAAGAREVVSFDMDEPCRQDYLPFHDRLPFVDRAAFDGYHRETIAMWRRGYWLGHHAMGSNAKVFYGDVYDLPAEIGQFDTVIVGSVLEHLADPMKALAAISRRADETMLIVTPMIDSDERIARFEGEVTRPDDDYVFWTWSRGLFREVLAMLDFRIERIAIRDFKAEWSDERQRRAILTARRGFDPKAVTTINNETAEPEPEPETEPEPKAAPTEAELAPAPAPAKPKRKKWWRRP